MKSQLAINLDIIFVNLPRTCNKHEPLQLAHPAGLIREQKHLRQIEHFISFKTSSVIVGMYFEQQAQISCSEPANR